MVDPRSSPSLLCCPVSLVVIRGNELMHSGGIFYVFCEPKIEQDTLSILDKGLSFVAEDGRIGGHLIDLKESSDEVRTLPGIFFHFFFLGSNINYSIFGDPILIHATAKVGQLRIAPLGRRTISSEGGVISEEDRRCSIYSIGPEASHDAVSVVGCFLSGHRLRSTAGSESSLSLRAMSSESEINRTEPISSNISGAKILQNDPIPELCAKAFDVDDEALCLLVHQAHREAILVQIPRNGGL